MENVLCVIVVSPFWLCCRLQYHRNAATVYYPEITVVPETVDPDFHPFLGTSGVWDDFENPLEWGFGQATHAILPENGLFIRPGDEVVFRLAAGINKRFALRSDVRLLTLALELRNSEPISRRGPAESFRSLLEPANVDAQVVLVGASFDSDSSVRDVVLTDQLLRGDEPFKATEIHNGLASRRYYSQTGDNDDRFSFGAGVLNPTHGGGGGNTATVFGLPQETNRSVTFEAVEIRLLVGESRDSSGVQDERIRLNPLQQLFFYTAASDVSDFSSHRGLTLVTIPAPSTAWIALPMVAWFMRRRRV